MLRKRYGDWLADKTVVVHRRGWFIISAPLFPGGQAPNLGMPSKIEGLSVVLRLRRRDLPRAIAGLEVHHDRSHSNPGDGRSSD